MEAKHSIRIWLLINILNCKLLITETILDGFFLKTCPRPLTPTNAVISYLVAPRFYLGKERGKYGVNKYQEHDKVYFQCQEGYSQVHQSIMYITCGSNGKWFPEPEKSGKCISNKNFDKCTVDLFQCATSEKCISLFKKCDCSYDCEDGSDEADCSIRRKYIPARTYGRDSAGIISSPGYPHYYPKHFSCVYNIYTLKNHHIQVDFEEFQLPKKVENKCIDKVSLVGIHPWYLTSKKKRHAKQHKAMKSSDLTESKCGSKKFKRVYSNSTYLTINVTLGYLGSDMKYRGFSLSWKVKSKEYFQSILKSAKREEIINIPTENNDDVKEGFYTVLTPIAISALLPLSLITFLCCRRRLRQRSNTNVKKNQKVIRSDNTEKKSKNTESPITLTENNLAQFESQLRCQHNNARSLSNPSSDYVMSTENIIEQIYSKKDTVEQTVKRNSYCSAQSESNRYIMSYELPLRHSPMSAQWHDRSEFPSNSRITHVSSNSPPIHTYRSNSPRQMHSQHSNSPHLKPHRCRHFRCSRNVTKLQNISYSSQSISSNLWNHRKHNTDHTHIYPMSSEYHPHLQPVDTEFKERDKQLNEDVYKHPVKDEDVGKSDFYVYTVDSSIQPHSVDMYHNNIYTTTKLKEIEHKRKKRCSERSQNMWPYPGRHPTHDIYKPSFCSTDRTRGGSLMCTH